MDIGATWYNKGKGNKGKRKGKGKSTTKAQAMAATRTTTAATTTKEEKANTINNRLDKEILSKEKITATKEKAKDTRTTRIWQRKRMQQTKEEAKDTRATRIWRRKKAHSNKGIGKGHKDNKDMAKEKDTAIKEKARGTTTINQEEKEQKESKQQMIATDADNQDTWPNNVEWRSTTAALATSTNDQTDDWHSQAHYDSNWRHQDQTQMQQLALPQPADSSAVPISGSQEAQRNSSQKITSGSFS